MGRLRAPEVPTWTLMLAHTGKIVAVRQEYESEKQIMGWVTVARESEVLPFTPPRRTPDQADGFSGDDGA